jgi:nicotinate-nucleotide adenylyltransferase
MTANIPPHRPQPQTSSYHRFAMVALAIADCEGWSASDLELIAASPSFTTGTLQRFSDRGVTPAEMFFIIGTDAFVDIESWKDFPAILDRAHFAVVSRPGLSLDEMSRRLPALASRMAAPADVVARATPSIFLIDAATADVSATAIRRRVARGDSIAGLVPAAVRQHIERHALYATAVLEEGTHRTSQAGRLHGQD